MSGIETSVVPVADLEQPALAGATPGRRRRREIGRAHV